MVDYNDMDDRPMTHSTHPASHSQQRKIRSHPDLPLGPSSVVMNAY